MRLQMQFGFKRGVQTIITGCTLVSFVTSGCGTIGIRYLGIRPDAPDMVPSQEVEARCKLESKRDADGNTAGCARFYQTVEWADHLVESYRSRATMNEWSIYAAGTIALAALAALGGLAAAGTATSETVGFVSVGSGFTSGFFGFLDNKTRAGFYTEAANDIATARAAAVKTAMTSRVEAVYWEQAGNLYAAVTEKANWLETQRKEAATKADVAKQIDQLNNRVDQLNSTLLSASIGELVPPNGKQGQTVRLTTPGADLQPYEKSLKLFVGQSGAKITDVDSKAVHFEVPGQPSGSETTYAVHLRLGNMTIAPAAGEAPKLKYN
jgi:hypothetical protein